MPELRSIVQRLLTPQGFAILFFFHVVVSMGLFLLGVPHQLAASGFELLDNRAGYAAEDILTTWTAYGENGRLIYQSFLLFADFPYAILTGVVSISALNVIRVSLPRLNLGGWVFAFPIIMVVIDVLENALLLSMLRSFPNINVTIAVIAGNITAVKLALVNVSFFLFLLAWILLIRNWMRRDKRIKTVQSNKT